MSVTQAQARTFWYTHLSRCCKKRDHRGWISFRVLSFTPLSASLEVQGKLGQRRILDFASSPGINKTGLSRFVNIQPVLSDRQEIHCPSDEDRCYLIARDIVCNGLCGATATSKLTRRDQDKKPFSACLLGWSSLKCTLDSARIQSQSPAKKHLQSVE